MSNKLTTNVQRCLHGEFARKCQEAGRGWSDYRFKSTLTRERAHCWTSRRHFGNKNSNERKLVVVSSRLSSRSSWIDTRWLIPLPRFFRPPDEGRSWRVYRKIRWIILKGTWRNRSWSRGVIYGWIASARVKFVFSFLFFFYLIRYVVYTSSITFFLSFLLRFYLLAQCNFSKVVWKSFESRSKDICYLAVEIPRVWLSCHF